MATFPHSGGLQRIRARARSGFHRALWHANRTAVAPLLKAAVVAAHPREGASRRSALGALAIDTEIRQLAATLRRDGSVNLDHVVDASLLASCLLTPGTRLWTRDRRLHAAALELGVGTEVA